mgnify:CR=1 FL=1
MGVGVMAHENTCHFRGVCLEKKTGKWRAEIQISGKKESLGYHKEMEDVGLAAAPRHPSRRHPSFVAFKCRPVTTSQVPSFLIEVPPGSP